MSTARAGAALSPIRLFGKDRKRHNSRVSALSSRASDPLQIEPPPGGLLVRLGSQAELRQSHARARM